METAFRFNLFDPDASIRQNHWQNHAANEESPMNFHLDLFFTVSIHGTRPRCERQRSAVGRSAGSIPDRRPDLDRPVDGKEVACRFTHSRDYAAQRTVPKELRIIRDYVQSVERPNLIGEI